MEGCACTSGFLLSGDTCVPETHCVCLFEGSYYSMSENPAPLPEHAIASTFLPDMLIVGVSLPAGRQVFCEQELHSPVLV